MCSSPKGGRTKPYLSSEVEGTFSDMTSAEYSDMVQRANESYEQRQLDLAQLRKNRKQKTIHVKKITPELSFYEKIKNTLAQFYLTHQIAKK